MQELRLVRNCADCPLFAPGRFRGTCRKRQAPVDNPARIDARCPLRWMPLRLELDRLELLAEAYDEGRRAAADAPNPYRSRS